MKTFLLFLDESFVCLACDMTDTAVNRKVQAVPQSEAAADPWHQEEEKKDRKWRVQNKQTNAREGHRLDMRDKIHAGYSIWLPLRKLAR